MKKSSVPNAAVIFATALVGIAVVVHAGNTNPPAGPVASTMKTLDQVEPRIPINSLTTPGDADSVFRVAQPGSYYLTSDVTGLAGRAGIEIASHDVTIDLMGYTLRGVAGTLEGIRTVGSAYNNLTVRNGVVTGWSGGGVDLSAAATGQGSLIEAVLASANGSFVGLSGNEGGIIRQCTAISNIGSGIDGFRASLIENCTARMNGSIGIRAQSGTVFRGCTSNENGDDGISAGSDSVVVHCSASDNTDDGITAGISSQVSNCTAGSNTGDGIEIFRDCLVLENQCYGNGSGTGDGAAIHATSTDNRIEANNVLSSDRGIDIDSTGNLIIRNSASGNAINYDIAANNKIGVIVAAPDSLAISGSTGGAGVGTSNPWANLSF